MAAAQTSRVIDRGWDREISHMRRLAGRRVKVGIQAGQGSQNSVDPLDILIYNEFGTRRIPARPVMRSYFDTYRREIEAYSDRAALFVFRTGQIDQALGMVGQYLQSNLQSHWRASKSWAVPNSPTTVRMKGSDVPLIDHGVLINAVRYQVS